MCASTRARACACAGAGACACACVCACACACTCVFVRAFRVRVRVRVRVVCLSAAVRVRLCVCVCAGARDDPLRRGSARLWHAGTNVYGRAVARSATWGHSQPTGCLKIVTIAPMFTTSGWRASCSACIAAHVHLHRSTCAAVRGKGWLRNGGSLASASEWRCSSGSV